MPQISPALTHVAIKNSDSIAQPPMTINRYERVIRCPHWLISTLAPVAVAAILLILSVLIVLSISYASKSTIKQFSTTTTLLSTSTTTTLLSTSTTTTLLSTSTTTTLLSTSTTTTALYTCPNFTVTMFWNYPFNDIASASPMTFDVCCAWCLATTACEAFVLTITTSTCWMKNTTVAGGVNASNTIAATR